MKINTFEGCVKIYNNDLKEQGGWDTEDNKKRSSSLETFPHSVIVEGNYLEYDVAEKWVTKNISPKDEKWTDLWYGKIGYDYGFWEFFFENKEDAEKFKESVRIFYAETSGKKWKTEGYDKHIEL